MKLYLVRQRNTKAVHTKAVFVWTRETFGAYSLNPHFLQISAKPAPWVSLQHLVHHRNRNKPDLCSFKPPLASFPQLQYYFPNYGLRKLKFKKPPDATKRTMSNPATNRSGSVQRCLTLKIKDFFCVIFLVPEPQGGSNCWLLCNPSFEYAYSESSISIFSYWKTNAIKKCWLHINKFAYCPNYPTWFHYHCDSSKDLVTCQQQKNCCAATTWFTFNLLQRDRQWKEFMRLPFPRCCMMLIGIHRAWLSLILLGTMDVTEETGVSINKVMRPTLLKAM